MKEQTVNDLSKKGYRKKATKLFCSTEKQKGHVPKRDRS